MNHDYTMRNIPGERRRKRYIQVYRQEERKTYWSPMTKPFGLINLAFVFPGIVKKPGNPGKRLCTERDLLVKRVESS